MIENSCGAPRKLNNIRIGTDCCTTGLEKMTIKKRGKLQNLSKCLLTDVKVVFVANVVVTQGWWHFLPIKKFLWQNKSSDFTKNHVSYSCRGMMLKDYKKSVGLSRGSLGCRISMVKWKHHSRIEFVRSRIQGLGFYVFMDGKVTETQENKFWSYQKIVIFHGIELIFITKYQAKVK